MLKHLLNCDHTIKVNKRDNKSVLWIKMINIQKKLDVKNIHDLVDKEIKGRFKTDNRTDEQIKKYKRHGSELIDGEKFVYTHEGVMIPVIMHSRTQGSCKFKIILRFKLHDVINCKEQTVLESIKDSFKGENMQTRYSVLGYKIDLYFHEYKLAIEVDELGHNDRNIDYEIQKQRAIEKELKAINEIHRHVKKSTKNVLQTRFQKDY